MSLGEFNTYYAACEDACKRRLLTAEEWARLRALWQAAEDYASDPRRDEEVRELWLKEHAMFIPRHPPAWELIEIKLGPPAEPELTHEVEAVAPTRGAKSRWRRADLEKILVTHSKVSARALAASGDLVEDIRHQRISELRKRGDVRVERGRLDLPEGTTADGGWVTLPKLD